jgi:hypothetical protein
MGHIRGTTVVSTRAREQRNTFASAAFANNVYSPSTAIEPRHYKTDRGARRAKNSRTLPCTLLWTRVTAAKESREGSSGAPPQPSRPLLAMWTWRAGSRINLSEEPKFGRNLILANSLGLVIYNSAGSLPGAHGALGS